MLKANELRLNNLLDYHGQSVRVMAVDRWSAEFGYFEDSVGFGRRFDESDFPKPIKLTEEWLLKFGFTKIDSYTFVLNGFFIHKRKIGFIFNIGKKKIIQKFVHSIQNTYFCIEQKELKWLDTAQQNI